MHRILLKNCIMPWVMNQQSSDAIYPTLETKYLIESEKEYPVSINGKMRTTIKISLEVHRMKLKKLP